MTQTFTVPGEPRGKGRPRFARTSKGVRTFTDDKTTTYENLIRWYYTQAYPRRTGNTDHPTRLTVTAHMPVPKSYPKRTHAAVASGVCIPHTKTPDIDNIVKAVLDALNGVAFVDDSCVSEIIARKIYSTAPRLEVEISAAALGEKVPLTSPVKPCISEA